VPGAGDSGGIGAGLFIMLNMDFYEKAHFVKPTWRLLSVAEAQLLISALRAMLLSALFR
jgi:glycerate kinase